MEGVPSAQNEGFLSHVEVQGFQRLLGKQLPQPAVGGGYEDIYFSVNSAYIDKPSMFSAYNPKACTGAQHRSSLHGGRSSVRKKSYMCFNIHAVSRFALSGNL